MRRVLSLPLLVGLTLAAAVPVVATTGVSIDTSRVAVTETLVPGGEYRLPAFGVRNPGTESTSYIIVVTYVDRQEAHQPPAEWFSFTPGSLTLDGGQSRAVSASLEVPPDAEPGTYEALVGPQIAAEGSGAQIGAGAAARLTFTVSECDGFECWLRWIGRWIGEHAYVLLIPAALTALVTTRIVRRRFAFSIQRRAA
jgi:hypothetical protein